MQVSLTGRVAGANSPGACVLVKVQRSPALPHLSDGISVLSLPESTMLCSSAGLLSLSSLQENDFLEDLILVGNPCTKWPGYRPYVVGLLSQLKRLVGDVLFLKVAWCHATGAVQHMRCTGGFDDDYTGPAACMGAVL